MHNNSMDEWVPWQSILEFINDAEVWGPLEEKTFWNIVMNTCNKAMNYHSYMVRYFKETSMAVVKITPKGGNVKKRKTEHGKANYHAPDGAAPPLPHSGP
eukprot:9691031-Heterocapsa_arctica.AAC.1